MQDTATRVDFYVLESTEASMRLLFACKLIEKIYKLKHRIVLCTGSAKESATIDKLLWTFREGGFVPHEVIGDSNDNATPIIISHEKPVDSGDPNTVLFNLGPVIPDGFNRFSRVIEVIDASDAVLKTGRQRFSDYRAAGIQPETHKIGNT